MTKVALIISGVTILGALLSFISRDANLNYLEEIHPPVVVLELFTSQGCSSCPPADRLLDQLAQRGDNSIITLSYHVAYWNYIGWTDPFSKEAHADKQRVYAKKFGEGRIYTPQLVVNGKEHFVGSDAKKMMGAVDHYGKLNTLNTFNATIVKSTLKKVEFEFELLGPTHGRNARAALVLEERETYVEKGENRKRTLKNTNIVVAETDLRIGSGTSSISIPSYVKNSDRLRLILIAENGRHDIVGATQVDI